MTFDSIRREVDRALGQRKACVCDGYDHLSCDVAGNDCAMREDEPKLGGASVTIPLGADSTWGDLLRESFAPMVRDLQAQRNVLLAELMRANVEAKERDDAFLASLTPHERMVELTGRRIARLEGRLAAWLEEHFTWRFAKERPDADW